MCAMVSMDGFPIENFSYLYHSLNFEAMIQEKLQQLKSLGIKVKSIDLTEFILNNIDWNKSFKNNHDVTIFAHDENNEIIVNSTYYFISAENRIGLTFKSDNIYSEIDIERDYQEMKVANFIVQNWDKLNFKMSE